MQTLQWASWGDHDRIMNDPGTGIDEAASQSRAHNLNCCPGPGPCRSKKRLIIL